MSLQWQSQRLTDGAVGTFVFNGNIASYAYGLSGFAFIYGSASGLQSLSVDLNAELIDANTIGVTATLDLADSSNPAFDKRDSVVFVTVLAWLSTDSSGIYLGQTPDLSLEGQQLNTGPLANFSTFLGSFQLSFTGQTSLSRLLLEPTASLTNGVLSVDATINMADGNGNVAKSSDFFAGIIGFPPGSPEFEFQQVEFDFPTGDINSDSKMIYFDNEISDLTAILLKIDVSSSQGLNPIVVDSYFGFTIMENDPVHATPAFVIYPGNKQVDVFADSCKIWDGNTYSNVNKLTFLVIARLLKS